MNWFVVYFFQTRNRDERENGGLDFCIRLCAGSFFLGAVRFYGALFPDHCARLTALLRGWREITVDILQLLLYEH